MSELPVAAGLLQRLRDAGRSIAWEEDPAGLPRRAGPRARVARLREERSRVEAAEQAGSYRLEVTAGPVGALLVLLEADRRGPPDSLGSRNAGRSPSFPDGSIVACWGGDPPAADARPGLRDLVDLARYALL